MFRTKHSQHHAYAILRHMKGGLKARGFTIIETLIVLAITGGLFAAVALSISGKQGRTQFEQSVNDVKAQIEQVINDVAVGFYPNTNNFRCQAGGFGPVLSTGTTAQGENTGCVFLGRVIQFGISGTDPEQFRIYTVTGLQRTTAGAEVTSYAQALPQVVAPTPAAPSTPDASTPGRLQYGLTICKTPATCNQTNVGAVAFMNSLASYSSGAIVSGSQQLKIIPITGSTLNVSSGNAAATINSNIAASPEATGSVSFCFISASSNQSGLIRIGNANKELSVTLSIKGNKTCS
jgi:prepilin-type N-terminal cleavage/methylation domain-containing protein